MQQQSACATPPMPDTVVAQISDLHVCARGSLAFGCVDTGAALRETVRALLALSRRPDAVIATGDLVDEGSDAEYAYLRELVAPLDMPLYLLPGNHDDRGALARAFADHPWLAATVADAEGRACVQYTAAIGRLRLVVIDTVEPGRTDGALCDARLDWLEATLARHAGEPVIVAMHHPPFRTMIDFMDGYGLKRGAGRLAQIVGRHPNVERVLCGHLHRAIDVRFGGTIASTSPAPAHQIHLDVRPGAPGAWTLEPPAFRVHLWSPDTGVVTHLASAGAFAGPTRFD
jgi:3',5'-cyclic AMP phosphodiesterase CpdA